MKRIINNLLFIAVAAMSIVACSKSPIEEPNSSENNSIILYANKPTIPNTKLAFEDKSTDGISLDWKVGDKISAYRDNAGDDKVIDKCVGNLVCKSVTDGIATFETEDGVTLTEGNPYHLVFPASSYDEIPFYSGYTIITTSNLETQNGNNISDIEDRYFLEADFTYSKSSQDRLTFVHNFAVLTVQFPKTKKPAKLEFNIINTTTKLDNSYTINFDEEEISSSDDYYYTYIVIEPTKTTSGQKQELTFSLYENSGDATPYDKRIVQTDKEYLAGYRYTAPMYQILSWEGDGVSPETPYLIKSANDLINLSIAVNSGNDFEGKYFKMDGDIDLENEPFTPIGTYVSNVDFTKIFAGSFDGGNYEVKNLNINNPKLDYQGLFSYLQTNGTIKNLTVSGSVEGDDYVGGVVGRTMKSTNIENCINNCTLEGSKYVGGIVGQNSGTVTYCINKGNVTGGTNIAGISGYQSNNISYCHNSGIITNDDSVYNSYTGGISGIAGGNIIESCYNTGKIIGQEYVGGITGGSSSTIQNCFNTAKIETESSSARAGGIVGQISGTITNCYNTGELEYTNTYTDQTRMGSVYGYVTGTSTLNITNSYRLTGSLEGVIYEGGTLNGAVAEKSEIEMKSSTFANTLNNGGTIWKYDSSLNSGYPVLIWSVDVD